MAIITMSKQSVIKQVNNRLDELRQNALCNEIDISERIIRKYKEINVDVKWIFTRNLYINELSFNPLSWLFVAIVTTFQIVMYPVTTLIFAIMYINRPDPDKPLEVAKWLDFITDGHKEELLYPYYWDDTKIDKLTTLRCVAEASQGKNVQISTEEAKLLGIC